MKPANKAKSIVQPVKRYTLPPEELEKYRDLKPPRDAHERLLRKAVKIRG